MMLERNDKELLDIVRRFDPDRYVAALFSPSKVTGPLMALYGLNAEFGRIASSVSEPMLGEIRLQWWRDALETAGAGGETGHPVADAFGRIMMEYSLPFYEVQGMIDARSFDVSGGVMADAQALNIYLDKTDGAVMRLAATVLGERNGAVERASRRAAYSYGLAQVLRLLPAYLHLGVVPLPEDELKRFGVEPRALLSGQFPDGWPDCLDHLLAQIEKDHRAFQTEIAPLSRFVRPAFFTSCLTRSIISKLRSNKGDIAQVLEINPLNRFWRIWRGGY